VAQVVLADEINRASPKTQAALLECMEERQVTVDGVTHPMPDLFVVLATQNPIEYEGTFPLPETELDRFMVRIHLGYPSPEHELNVLASQQFRHPIEQLSQVIDDREMRVLHESVREVRVGQDVQEYIVALANATRKHPNLYLGASPRGSLALFRLAQARALLDGRDYALPDDVKELAYPALGHRVILSSAARIQGVSPQDTIAEVLDSVPVPGAAPR
ncbi:MAG: MoxR family ATPase, partial [SAR202 cluster bacterium]|nr:MoxR family ATPase [SAR202 cluster bacterium]